MIRPSYVAIKTVADIVEPWIYIWEGDEWGESMRNLLGATHTDYGISDEDCAAVAEILLRNVIKMREWMKVEGNSYGLSTPEMEAQARKDSTQARDYWLKGGNLGVSDTVSEDAKDSIDQMPDWMFNA